jgi:hypothetical protein
MDAMLVDSNISPTLLLSDIYALSGAGISDFGGWVDQVLLFFLIGVPKALWPGKPFGFGYQYTVDNMPDYLVDAGHSIAATFVGEHIYYLGWFLGLAGAVLSVAMLASLYKLLNRETILGGYGAIAVAVWLPTWYWGGLASFSARFLASAAPLVILYLFHRIYVRQRGRASRQAHARHG